MPAIEWTTAEQTTGGPGLPMKVKVDGETGGAWLLYSDGYGLAFAWCPNTEGVLNFLLLMGATTTTVLITQEAFDELTDDSKWAYIRIARGKP